MADNRTDRKPAGIRLAAQKKANPWLETLALGLLNSL